MPHVIDPDFAAYVANSVDSIPSSGYFAILLALQMCHEVNLFGFYASNRHGSRHHYYNSEVPSNSNRDEQEFDKVQRLVANGLVKFGDPCVVECHASQQECETCWRCALPFVVYRSPPLSWLSVSSCCERKSCLQLRNRVAYVRACCIRRRQTALCTPLHATPAVCNCTTVHRKQCQRSLFRLMVV